MNKNQKAAFDTIHYLISVIKSLKNQSVKKQFYIIHARHLKCYICRCLKPYTLTYLLQQFNTLTDSTRLITTFINAAPLNFSYNEN